MLRKSFILFFFLFLAAIKLVAQEIEFTEAEQKWIKEHPVIYHAYDASWHPFEFYNEKDSLYYGIIGDYINIVEEKTGITINPLPNISWEESLKKLKKGDIDLATGIIATEERKKYLNFTKPYVSYPLVIVTRKDFDFIGGLEDLNGRAIALPKSYFTSENIAKDFPEISITHTQNVNEALKLVSYGNVDAFVGNLAVVSYYINNEGYTNLKIAAPTRYKDSELSFGVRKDWPELVSIADKIFDKISQAEHNEIKNRWINVRYEYGINLKRIIWVSVISVSIVLIIIGVILFWNRRLQNEIIKRNEIEEKLENSLLELEKKNEEKRAMLKEIHHRVKNNLQVVNSLLKFQSRKLESEEAITMFEETRNRVVSMALLHEKMYRSDDISHIDVHEYITLLVEDLVKNYAVDKKIALNIKIEHVDLMMRTLVPLGLIINEIISNSLKHGFKGRNEGEITVHIKSLENLKYEMIIGDDGVGIKKGKKSTGIGVKLIKTFTKQLNGVLEQLEQPGTVFKLVFEKIDVS